ncbi:helix-turn-helix domain-containing protein [Furfurilactobacillus entadae]|uniref:helix-turn-helix domain-containing protein n=1 Tax=Furfurilactobacillus entadae TaxID=2922307 RepID=UPI0035EE873B
MRKIEVSTNKEFKKFVHHLPAKDRQELVAKFQLVQLVGREIAVQMDWIKKNDRNHDEIHIKLLGQEVILMEKDDSLMVAIDDMLTDDLNNSDFEKGVKTEKNKLISAVVVRQERLAYGWTQAELATKAGVPQATIARVEGGHNTSLDTLSKIANAFGKSLQITFA